MYKPVKGKPVRLADGSIAYYHELRLKTPVKQRKKP